MRSPLVGSNPADCVLFAASGGLCVDATTCSLFFFFVRTQQWPPWTVRQPCFDACTTPQPAHHAEHELELDDEDIVAVDSDDSLDDGEVASDDGSDDDSEGELGEQRTSCVQ